MFPTVDNNAPPIFFKVVIPLLNIVVCVDALFIDVSYSFNPPFPSRTKSTTALLATPYSLAI